MRRKIDVREQVDEPYWRVTAVLGLDADAVISPAMHEVRLAIGGTELSRKVQCDVGERVREEHCTRVPLRWHAETHAHWFPTVEAVLELAPLGASATGLRLRGDYEPPLGAVGAVGDVVVGHVVADHALREFVTSVAQRLTDAVAAHTLTPR